MQIYVKDVEKTSMDALVICKKKLVEINDLLEYMDSKDLTNLKEQLPILDKKIYYAYKKEVEHKKNKYRVKI